MLILENVRRIGETIQADFFFEGTTTKGAVVYDISLGQVIKAVYGNKNPLVDYVYGFGYVKSLFDKMAKANKYPETITYRWY